MNINFQDIDYSNLPSTLYLGYLNAKTGLIDRLLMPKDVRIYPPFEKSLVESKILDGPSIVERVGRLAYHIEIECTLTAQRNKDGDVINGFSSTQGYYDVFPQQYLNEIFSKIIQPDTVIKVDNTFLNGLGISEIIIQKAEPTPQAGSMKIALRISCIENIEGNSLII